jgi:UDP-N-acetylglucosamine diphosphorylase/glucosamine-1-phosphate N-acetyltransferase
MAQMAARKITRTAFVCRPWLAPQVERMFPGAPVNALVGTDDLLFLNGATLFFKGELERFLRQLNDVPALESGGRLVAARVRAEDGRKLMAAIAESWGPGPIEAVPGPPSWPRGFKPKPVAEPVRFLTRPWDLVHANEATLIDDFAITRPGKEPALPVASPGAHLVKKNRILSRPGCRVMPGAVLDASTGPIILGEGVRILHNAVVLGPAYIGPNSLIKVGAKIYAGTSIGPVCKVGGEVEGSILHGYANKQHDGFLGHSYLAEWTNVGAGTDTSDLKNNYGRVAAWGPGGLTDTGLTFAGLILGDHAKCGIGTMFNTGTVVGPMSNVFGAGYPPKHVPSFGWGGAPGIEPYDLDKALAVAALVTARRQKTFEPIDEALYRKVFQDTAAHRR